MWWDKHDAMEARLTASLSERMIDLAALAPGLRVLDLASGRGEPSWRAARRVAPSGSVLGIDMSSSALAMAKERAAAEGVSNIEFRVGDAELLEGVANASYDAALVRWGLMYMPAPERALAGVYEALVPDGVFVIASWAELERIPWYAFPRRVLARHAEVKPIDPDAPGPCRHAVAARLDHDLERAGFRVEHTEDVDVPIVEAKTGEEIVEWVRDVGFARALDERSAEERAAWAADLAREAEQLREGAWIRLGGVTRLTVVRKTARKTPGPDARTGTPA